MRSLSNQKSVTIRITEIVKHFDYAHLMFFQVDEYLICTLLVSQFNNNKKTS